jgi:Tol biopolymer transport system component
VLLESVRPVGYYAWSDEHTVALYILGQPGSNQPSTLQLADTRANNVRSIATDIGRSLLPMPGGQTVSFVQRSVQGETTTLSIKVLDPATGAVRALTAAVEGTTEVNAAWTADGTLLTIQNDHLFAWRRGANGWSDVASLDRLGLRSATRLAVSPDSRWIAVVASPQ